MDQELVHATIAQLRAHVDSPERRFRREWEEERRLAKLKSRHLREQQQLEERVQLSRSV